MKSVEIVIAAGMICLLVLFVGISTGYGATHYVALCGAHTAPYTNWAMAATNIQAAVDVAVSGETVMVSNGTYYISTQISITNGIALVSMNTPQQTVIDASNNCRCVMMDHTNTFLGGFTLTNGHVGGVGGGVFLANGMISNCIISGNIAEGGHYGGGVHCVTGSLSHCLIIGNAMMCGGNEAYGGGIYVKSVGYIERCIIKDNQAYDYGSGPWYSSAPGNGWAYGGGIYGGVIKDSLICLNVAYAHGDPAWYCCEEGVGFAYGGGACGSVLTNCVLYGNTAHGDHPINARAWGGGAFSSKLVNCSVAMNTADTRMCGVGDGSTLGGGVYECEAINSIVWTNMTVGNWTSQFEGVGTYCCVYPALEGEGNITNDPRFANMQAGDLHLCGLSPSIDAGTNQAWMTNSVDVDGNPRIYNGTVDMGAYETLVTVCGVIFSGSVFSTDWYCESGSVCRLEYATEYPPTNWFHVGGSYTANQAGISLQDTNVPTAGRYYRVWWDQP